MIWFQCIFNRNEHILVSAYFWKIQNKSKHARFLWLNFMFSKEDVANCFAYANAHYKNIRNKIDFLVDKIACFHYGFGPIKWTCCCRHPHKCKWSYSTRWFEHAICELMRCQYARDFISFYQTLYGEFDCEINTNFVAYKSYNQTRFVHVEDAAVSRAPLFGPEIDTRLW